ncbi:hypothetical protein RBI22_15270 [Alcaligenaceae bacterium C4P045]|nr:hypothetical protein [Alcaligenaceae bacterium C4P045]
MQTTTHLKGGKLARLAGQLCRKPDFLAFCRANSSDDAAEFIRRTCDIESRAELDHNPKAAALFHQHVRQPFAYRNEGGSHA